MARLRAQIAPRPLQYADAVRALRVHADPHKARVSRGFLKGSKHHFCRSFLAEVGAFTPPSTGISSKVTRLICQSLFSPLPPLFSYSRKSHPPSTIQPPPFLP